MRIGLVLPGFSASETDWCIPVQLALVRELAQRAEVHIFPMRYPFHRRPYRVHGAWVWPLGGETAGGVGRLPLLARTWQAIARQHAARPFDALHGMWADEPGFAAVAAGRALGIPSVVSLLGGELVGFPDLSYGSRLSRVNPWLTRYALARADRVLAGSAYLRRLAAPYAAPHRLLSLPLGVDTARFTPGGRAQGLPLQGGRVKLLNAASLVPIKQQTTLLRAMPRVVAAVPDVHLHLVGVGPLRDTLARLAVHLGVAGHVTLHAGVPHDQMPAVYRAADLCVLSSRHEGQELATLEAGACGKATVGTEVGLLPDLVPATRAVPVGDSAALADALVDVMTTPGAMAGMGMTCLAAVRTRYDLGRTVENLMTLYTRLKRDSDT